MKKWFSFKSIKAWFISAVTFVVLVIVVDVLAFGVFYKPIVMALGSERPSTATTWILRMFPRRRANRKPMTLRTAITSGFAKKVPVLLKNANQCPSARGGQQGERVRKELCKPRLRGDGFERGQPFECKRRCMRSLEAAGFEYNPTLKSFYDDDKKSGSGRGEIRTIWTTEKKS